MKFVCLFQVYASVAHVYSYLISLVSANDKWISFTPSGSLQLSPPFVIKPLSCGMPLPAQMEGSQNPDVIPASSKNGGLVTLCLQPKWRAPGTQWQVVWKSKLTKISIISKRIVHNPNLENTVCPVASISSRPKISESWRKVTWPFLKNICDSVIDWILKRKHSLTNPGKIFNSVIGGLGHR